MQEVTKSLEDRQLYIDSVRENTARHAYVYGVFQTTGWGCVVFDTDVEFGLQFSEQPIVAYGAALSGDEQGTITQDTGDYTDFPRVSGGVHRWRVNNHGMYTGAACWGCVELASITDYNLLDPPELPADYTIDHHFSFAGIGVKMIPAPDFTDDD